MLTTRTIFPANRSAAGSDNLAIFLLGTSGGNQYKNVNFFNQIIQSEDWSYYF